MSFKNLVFVGNIVNPMCITTDAYLTVENGKITAAGDRQTFEQLHKNGSFRDYEIIQLTDDQFLMPGFVDCHTHAPQYPNLCLGLDKPLLEWLDSYIFPLEKKYSDVNFASSVYDKVVRRLLNNGVTTACYFSSIHLESTFSLVKSVINHRQRALVGKVSMDEKDRHGYRNDIKQDLIETEEFVKKVMQLQNNLVQPVITPRGALNCTSELMNGLGMIANKYDCRIQTHLSENLNQVKKVLQKYPECSSFTDVYDKYKVLTNKSIVAHAVHLSEEEMKLLATRGVSVAHCPAANTRLVSGTCPVAKLVAHGITVGLGTDVSAGDNATILDAVRRALDVATFLKTSDKITCEYAIYMATLGGAKALGLDAKIGSLEVGKEFDALLVDVYPPDGPLTQFPQFPELSPRDERYAADLLHRFTYAGDDRNILQVYVNGHKVKDITK